MVTYDERQPPVMPHDHLTMWSCEVRLQTKNKISPRSMTTKLGRVMSYDEGNSPFISHDPLTTFSREITWPNKSLILTFSQDL